MKDKFLRTKVLLGDKAMDKLYNSRVAVFGIGGVGGHVVEALVRSGVGYIDIIDKDDVSESNINRQLIATTKTVGKAKVDVMMDRMLEINPDVIITKHKCFYLPETRDLFDFSKYDYIVDAVDTVTAKIDLVMAATEAGVPIISSMGAGNKLDPTAFEVTDIYKTSVCPLAKVMRKELKKRNIKHLKVVYSKEEPIKIQEQLDDGDVKKNIPGSIAFVPSVVGLIIAGEVIRDFVEVCR
ncbi:MAG: tRNA threonylcarbamoyladenosine dehydratase [Lachnospiraceae bacterium]|nr:tRNA threonylcarbamoyladenosine dehydratase [Lachnospiraceae bacterium]